MWRIIGLIESRSGDLEILPQHAIAAKDGAADFDSWQIANTIVQAMMGHYASVKEKSAIRYLIVPVIDDALLKQVHGSAPQQPVAPSPPQISFSGVHTPA